MPIRYTACPRHLASWPFLRLTLCKIAELIYVSGLKHKGSSSRSVVEPLGSCLKRSLGLTDSGSRSEVLAVKEVAVMILMDTLTDKPDWHKKVFD